MDASINALGPLCVPIDPTWNLDGKAGLEDCEYGNVNWVNPGYNTWIDPTNGLWNVDNHWSRLFVPLSCDNVVISGGNTIHILKGDVEECHSLKVETGGEVKIELGGQLMVKEE